MMLIKLAPMQVSYSKTNLVIFPLLVFCSSSWWMVGCCLLPALPSGSSADHPPSTFNAQKNVA